MKRIALLLVILVFAALGATGFWAYETYLAVFPPLPSGLYAGMIGPAEREPVALLIDSRRGERDLWVAVGDQAMPAQRAKTADSSGSTGLPLIVTGEGTRLRLIGVERRDGELEGTFIDPIRNERGRWSLRRVSSAPMALSAPESESLQSWALAHREMAQARAEADAAGDGRVARGAAAQAQAQDQGLLELQAELQKEVQAFEQAAKLTPQGELVRLSRETVRREGRWIQDVLERGTPETRPSFERELEHAYAVKELLDQISEERRLLDGAESEGPPESAPQDQAMPEEVDERDEGFYRDL